MPSANERIPNTALSGAELKQIILEDFTRMLSAEGILSDHMAFGRVAYKVDLRLELDNPYNPESTSSHSSRPIARNVVEAAPELGAIESPPLDAVSNKSIKLVKRLKRKVTSPNAERLRTGMKVPVEVKQQDGTTDIQRIQYPPQPELGEGDIIIEEEVIPNGAD